MTGAEDVFAGVMMALILGTFYALYRGYRRYQEWVQRPYDGRAAWLRILGRRKRRRQARAHTGPHWLYRWYGLYRGKPDVLLYVGITSRRIQDRLLEHWRTKHWAKDARAVRWESYPSRRAVEDAEEDAIQRERPVYNIMHNRRR